MHTGKYEKLRFRNICRVCEAAGWAAECLGPRSSPATVEWRVMRILYPSVFRHSPSSPPTFFILPSHHTNSCGHKMEKKPVSMLKWKTEQFVGRLSDLPSLTFAICSLSMIDSHADIYLLLSPLILLFYCPLHPKPTPSPVLPTPAATTSSPLILWPSDLTLLKTAHRFICWCYWAKQFVTFGSWWADGSTESFVALKFCPLICSSWGRILERLQF